MGVDDCGRYRVHSDIDLLVLDKVVRNDGAGDRCDAEDIDACRPRSGRIFGISAIAGDVITDDNVVVHILAGIGGVQVERDARQAITR